MTNNRSNIQVFTDGASRGNPGMAGAGILISIQSINYSLSLYLGKKTNNEAEYLALFLAIQYLHRLINQKLDNEQIAHSHILFYLDSKLVVEQMSDRWKIKDERMSLLVKKCKEKLEEMGVSAEFIHIKRELNQEADWLANQAIDLATDFNK